MEVLIRDGLTIMRKTVLMALLLLVCDAQVLLALLHNSRTFKRNASNHNGDYKRAITETGKYLVLVITYLMVVGVKNRKSSRSALKSMQFYAQ